MPESARPRLEARFQPSGHSTLLALVEALRLRRSFAVFALPRSGEVSSTSTFRGSKALM